MKDLIEYIPLDKSWTIRMGILDILNGHKDILRFLDGQKDLGDDLVALRNVAEKWDTNEPLDVGESATLYRMIRYALWKQGKDREIVKRGTLKNRPIYDDSKITKYTLRNLLELDNGTSQWASAAVLAGGKRKSIIPAIQVG
jgi:hypothetical protein